MANVPVTVVQAVRAGVTRGAGTTSQLSGSGTHSFVNDGKTILYVETGAGAETLTFTIPANNLSDGQSTTRVVAVGATSKYLVGPFDPGIYGTTVTFTAATTTTTLFAFTH